MRRTGLFYSTIGGLILGSLFYDATGSWGAAFLAGVAMLMGYGARVVDEKDLWMKAGGSDE